MSTPTKARSKRALPSVPLERAASVDRIVTGTPKSVRNVSKRLDGYNVEPTCVDVPKNRNFASQQQQQQKSGPNMNSKLRSELCSRRKDLSSSESGSNASSPFDSPRETRKAAAVAPIVAQIIDKFNSGFQETSSLETNDVKEESVNTEKKIARVLPMTPQFLEDHTSNYENEPFPTKHAVESITNLKITNLQSALEDNNNSDEVKGSFAHSRSKNVLDLLQAKLAGTPKSVSTTPHQPPVEDGEGSSVRVGVRVRPFLPRYKDSFV